MTQKDFVQKSTLWHEIAQKVAESLGLEFLDHGADGIYTQPSYKVSVRANVTIKSYIKYHLDEGDAMEHVQYVCKKYGLSDPTKQAINKGA